MSDALRPDQPWSQPSLLEEPEATLAIRVHVVRGDPWCPVSFTITRPDNTWLACEVVTSGSGPEAIGTTLADVMGKGMTELHRLIGPF